MTTEEKDMVERHDTQEQAKKPYTTPRLTVYGTVEQITKAVAGAATDVLVTGSQII